jgi:hypothetical protein
MKCTHLIKGRILSCKALERPYVPSLYQLAEYCRSAEHRKCPFYLETVICMNRLEDDVSATLSFSGM